MTVTNKDIVSLHGVLKVEGASAILHESGAADNACRSAPNRILARLQVSAGARVEQLIQHFYVLSTIFGEYTCSHLLSRCRSSLYRKRGFGYG